jgi:hypothetical protein
MSLRDELSDLFFRHDPVGLAEIGAPQDEYWPEAQDLLTRLREATSQEHLRRIVHSIFLQKFGAEETCGPESAYEQISQEIWTRFLVNSDVRRSWFI